ncbi:sugar ABC transporter permease [Sphaerimonospora thailandensis]|uniref:Binding-protein-dependent transport system inner membrane component n=1 Tax=Sphaerimonospora thailandensis TaxID=795644 RepID=A0A8J3R9D7_9ACTN|nr:sugar ABC transporter permease [Sphaerimonospora thailandensis]GIH68443.1 hypothetical protein Mth01_06960 [Sphaerimonospora thailandensis]
MNVIPATDELVGLHDYVEILTSAAFVARLAWTTVGTTVCVALHVGIGLGMALLLNRPMRMRSVYRALLGLGLINQLPSLVIAYLTSGHRPHRRCREGMKSP